MEIERRRIIFVGIHNKPKRKALDSRTRSGIVIDKIASHIGRYQIVKTNLFSVDYYPKTKEEKDKLKKNWIETNNPIIFDIVVVLGKDCKKEFDFNLQCRVVYLEHPASRRIKNFEDYIFNSTNLILNIK